MKSSSGTGVRSWRQWRLWLAGLFGARYDGLANFHVVEPGVLMRCGQPHTRDLDLIHARHGLRTIVVARGGIRHPLRGRWFRREQRWCAAHGAKLVHIPFSDQAAPPAEVFDSFLKLFAVSSHLPVLVHCEQGFHRTGILCAAYRVARHGWPLERALEELAGHGFETHRPKRRALLEALRAWSAQRAADSRATRT